MYQHAEQIPYPKSRLMRYIHINVPALIMCTFQCLSHFILNGVTNDTELTAGDSPNHTVAFQIELSSKGPYWSRKFLRSVFGMQSTTQIRISVSSIALMKRCYDQPDNIWNTGILTSCSTLPTDLIPKQILPGSNHTISKIGTDNHHDVRDEIKCKLT